MIALDISVYKANPNIFAITWWERRPRKQSSNGELVSFPFTKPSFPVSSLVSSPVHPNFQNLGFGQPVSWAPPTPAMIWILPRSFWIKNTELFRGGYAPLSSHNNPFLSIPSLDRKGMCLLPFCSPRARLHNLKLASLSTYTLTNQIFISLKTIVIGTPKTIRGRDLLTIHNLMTCFLLEAKWWWYSKVWSMNQCQPARLSV